MEYQQRCKHLLEREECWLCLGNPPTVWVGRGGLENTRKNNRALDFNRHEDKMVNNWRFLHAMDRWE